LILGEGKICRSRNDERWVIMKKTVCRILIFVLFIVSFYTGFWLYPIIMLEGEDEVSKMYNDIVKDEKIAIEIARIAVKSVYGSDDSSYIAKLDSASDLWTVVGVLPEGWLGGVAEVIIDKNDGRIVNITHGK